jgi:pSer/pThr/pTyr-binding forkhead associated (FHA) protein
VRAYWLEYRGSRHRLRDGETLVGRGDNCTLLVDDPSVSRAHAVVRRSGTRVFVRDLRSSNGTFVNGRRVEDARALEPGDEIALGDSRVKLVVSDAPEPAAIAPGIEIIEQKSVRPQTEVTTAPQFSSIEVLESLIVNAQVAEDPRALAHMIRTSVDRLLATTESRKQTISRDYAARLASIVEIAASWFSDGSLDEWKASVLAKLTL